MDFDNASTFLYFFSSHRNKNRHFVYGEIDK